MLPVAVVGNVDPQMPPERFSCQCARELDEKSSLPLQMESEGRNLAGFLEEFDSLAKDRKLFYINDLMWLGRQDSNLGSRDQSPLPYRLATPQSVANRALPDNQTVRPLPSAIWDGPGSPTNIGRGRQCTASDQTILATRLLDHQRTASRRWQIDATAG